MDDERPNPTVEVGRIVFRSWEHEWQTGERDCASLALAARLLPASFTQPIYDILGRWEQELERSSLPYPPYGLRIRRGKNQWLPVALADYGGDPSNYLTEFCRRKCTLCDICPGWEEALPEPRVKKGKFGNELFAPGADTPLEWKYSFEWQSAIFPEREVRIADLLGPCKHAPSELKRHR
jgi:hypothetical protein